MKSIISLTNLVLVISIVLESFPVSSSAHVYLVSRALFSCTNKMCASFIETAELLSHGVYIFVLALFFYTSYRIYLTRDKRLWKIVRKIIGLGVIVESVSLAMYMLVHRLQGVNIIILGLCCTSILLLSLNRLSSHTHVYVTWNKKNALLLGLAQGCAFVPGLSRFAATYVMARWLGIRAQRAFELSFLILVPISGAACLLGIYRTFELKHYYLLHAHTLLFMLVASGGMYIGLNIMQVCIKQKKVWVFGLYTLALAMLLVCNYT